MSKFLNIVAHACNELYSVDEEHIEKYLVYISSISAELAPEVLQVALVPERITIVGVAGEIMKFSIFPRYVFFYKVHSINRR